MTSELLLTLATIITSIGVLVAAILAVYKVARRIGDAIGVDSNGKTISERLDRVEHQLWENGGSSLADRVNRIESHAEVTNAKLDLIETILVAGLTQNEPKKTVRKPRQKSASSIK